MKEPARCTLSTITISVPGRASLTIAQDAVVDLAQELAPGLTLRDTVTKYAAAFVPVVPPAPRAVKKQAEESAS